ncbi:MAG: hypothetical protein Q7W16_06995 [Coriobacteriia bacterium]|nr:hypothetical protein [Coriobacteriia bacterium]
MLRRAVLLGMVLCVVLAAGCTPSTDSLNASAKEATSYDSPQAVYDAMKAGGVDAVALIDEGDQAGPAGTVMAKSAEVNFGDGFGTITVFPSAGVPTMGEYVTVWLSSAKSSGVEDPTVLQGPNWLVSRGGDLSKVQQALGGKLQK